MKRLAFGSLIFFLLVSAQAWATSFQLGSVIKDDTAAGAVTFALVSPAGGYPYTFNLNTMSDANSYQVLTMTIPRKQDMSAYTGNLNLTFDFNLPSGITDVVDVAGIYVVSGSGVNKTMQLTWSDPVSSTWAGSGAYVLLIQMDDYPTTAVGSSAICVPLSVHFKLDDPQPTVPEPASLVLLGSGLLGIGVLSTRRRNRR